MGLLTDSSTFWNGRPLGLLAVLTLGSLYAGGWRHLRKGGDRRGAPTWRLVLYLLGLGALAVALLSPIDHLASVLLTAHMIQHLLLIMIAPPLLLLGNPLPACLWGLPRPARRAVGRLLTRHAACRKGLWALTFMPVAWLLYVGNLWAWHLPLAYQAALRHHLLHDVEHVAFFGTALLFWWPLIEPAPRLHRRLHPGFAVPYLLAATGQNILLSALIALPERVVYPYYTASSRLFGMTPHDDQALAGGIMWISSHMYLIPLLLIVAKTLGREEQEAVLRQGTESGTTPADGGPGQ